MDRLEHKKITSDTAQANAQQDGFNPMQIGEKKRAFVSKGEHLHKWSTYLILDWVVNTTVGVSFSYWGKFTEIGRKIWSEPLTKFFNHVLTPFIKNPEIRAKSAGFGNIFASIITGGMFILPPLMLLESNKVRKSVTKFFDRMIYGKDKVEHDSKFQQAYAEMDEKPKKGFWVGMLARVAALAPELAIILIPTTKEISNKLVFNHLERASESLATKAGFSAASFKKMPLAEGEKRWKFIHENVALDFGLSGPYALMHAVFYNIFANMFDKKAKQKKMPVSVPPAPMNVAEAPIVAEVKTETETVKFTDKAEKKSKPAPVESYAVNEIFRKAEPVQAALS